MAALRRKNKQRNRAAPSQGPGKGPAGPQRETVIEEKSGGNGHGVESGKKSGHHVTSSDIVDNMKGSKEVEADRRVAIYIAVLAVFLAICTMGGDNATKDATRNNILATDTWAHYQAKRLRETNYRLAADSLELKLAAEPGVGEEAKNQILGKIKDYRAEAARLKSDPKGNDGQVELMAKARVHEAERDIAIRRDPYFDYATAFLQIAIVLASAAIVFGGGGILLTSSILLGAAGIGLMANGFTLVVNVPFVG